MIENIKDTIVFDLETQNSFEDVGGRFNADKLRISVAGVYSYNRGEFMYFFEDEIPAFEKMLINAGMVIGFNTIGFDYHVLKQYVGFIPASLPTLDIMDQVVKSVGHRVSLDSVAGATLNAGKSGDGLKAIRLWREGKIGELVNYCLDDVRLTRDIFDFGRQQGRIFFESKHGGKREVKVDWSGVRVLENEK